MNSIAKIECYDDFSCIADKCSFSCCKGWEIIVDIDTYNKWNSDETQFKYICKYVKMKKNSNETEYFIKMGNHMSCPFLDEKFLCNIVINHGEDYLPKTCRTFPRLENSFGNINEYSLSCACPAVVDIINSINGKIKFSHDVDQNIMENLPIEYNIRELMITISQNSKFSLNDRILLIFNMLLFLKKQSVITKEILSRFLDEKYLCSLTDIWNGIEIDNEDSCRELNELFLDITENYKKEKNFRNYLKDISELAEDMEVESSQIKWNNIKAENSLIVWNNFKEVFGQYERLLENCIVSKIFSNCISDDIDEMIMSYQIVITEYIMVKYSAFLRWLMNDNKTIDYNDLRDYIVTYSRIIGYNSDGIIEFWEDTFDEAIWEFGYMFLLIN